MVIHDRRGLVNPEKIVVNGLRLPDHLAPDHFIIFLHASGFITGGQTGKMPFAGKRDLLSDFILFFHGAVAGRGSFSRIRVTHHGVRQGRGRNNTLLRGFPGVVRRLNLRIIVQGLLDSGV